MTLQVDYSKLIDDPAYRELYVRYIDSLTVLGELASRCDMAEVCMADEIHVAVKSAAAFLGPRTVVQKFDGTAGFRVTPRTAV